MHNADSCCLRLTARSASSVDAHLTYTSSARVSTEHDWRAGVRIVSEREPRLVLYPNFLSTAEVDWLVMLSRDGALEAAAAAGVAVTPAQALTWDVSHPTLPAKRSGRTVSIHVPLPNDDATIRSIEERCAAVTGIPLHPDEEPLGVRHTSASSQSECDERFCTALHVDTNQGGHYRCATVLLYLHDVTVGGETRFPCVGADCESPLREAAERLCALGTTAFGPSPEVEWPPLACRATLMAAAESPACGAHVRPRKGLAAVFWTHTAEGLDRYSWHTGARLPPEATSGKLIAQKFKSLPMRFRRNRREEVRLPAELAPPVVAAS